MFPRIGRCEEFGGSLSRMWNAFSEQQEVAQKTGATTAGEVCHEAATVVDTARLEDAADAIVRRKVHRLAVVDATGKCVGVLSRGDILKATLNVRLSVVWLLEPAHAAWSHAACSLADTAAARNEWSGGAVREKPQPLRTGVCMSKHSLHLPPRLAVRRVPSAEPLTKLSALPRAHRVATSSAFALLSLRALSV